MVRVIAPPFVLLDDARNSGTGSSSYVRETVALDEGSVSEVDVTPLPSRPQPTSSRGCISPDASAWQRPAMQDRE